MGFQNPQAFFWYACKHSEHFAKIVKEGLEDHPCAPNQPWSILVYQDGVNPGDTKAKNQERNTVVFYWTFLEFGMRALAHEECWGTLTLQRKKEADKLESTIGQLASLAMRRFFMKERSFRHGIAVELATGGEARIYAKIKGLLADEPALKEILACKGHGGLMRCPLCKNAAQHRGMGGHPPLWQTTDAAISIAETDITKFERHSDQSLRSTVSLVHRYKNTLGSDEYDEKSILHGFNYNPFSVILDDTLQLDAAKAVHFDWNHILVSDGIVDVEFAMCFHAMVRTHTKLRELGEYQIAWTYPNGRKLNHIFTKSKITSILSNESWRHIK